MRLNYIELKWIVIEIGFVLYYFRDYLFLDLITFDELMFNIWYEF